MLVSGEYYDFIDKVDAIIRIPEELDRYDIVELKKLLIHLNEREEGLKKNIKKNLIPNKDSPSYEELADKTLIHDTNIFQIQKMKIDVQQRIENIQNPLSKINSYSGSLNWTGDVSDMVELIKALVESKKINNSQSEIIKSFEGVFDIDLSRFSTTLNDFQYRNIENQTKYLDSMKANLLKWLSKHNKRT